MSTMIVAVAPVPQFQEETVGVIQLSSRERTSECMVVGISPQKRITEHAQIVQVSVHQSLQDPDASVLRFQEEGTVGMIQLSPREHTSEFIGEGSVPRIASLSINRSSMYLYSKFWKSSTHPFSIPRKKLLRGSSSICQNAFRVHHEVDGVRALKSTLLDAAISSPRWKRG